MYIREFCLFLLTMCINMNNQFTKISPIITYNNLDLNKSTIYNENYKKSGIYRWNNLVTGKSYVGSSINLSQRFTQYYSSTHLRKKQSSIIYRSILKYGYIKFSLDILEYCESSLCLSREQYYLDILKPEYNILKIAGSNLGSKQSEATKIKKSYSKKGILNPFYGKTHTDETRKKMQFSQKSLIRVNNKPRVVTIKTKFKMSLKCKGVSVKVFDKSNNSIKEFPTITTVAKYFGISIRTVGRYLDKNKSYNGFLFKSNLTN